MSQKDYDKMKVADLKILANQYGIKKEDIVGHGVNGRLLGADYADALKKFDEKLSVKNIASKQSIKNISKKSPTKTIKNVSLKKSLKSTKHRSPVKESTTKSIKNISPVKESTTKSIKHTSPVKESKKEIINKSINIKHVSPVKESKKEIKDAFPIKKSNKNISPVKEPKKEINKKCATPTMTDINEYKKCDVDKICNVATGNCIANTKVNKKNKIILQVDDRKLVGDEATITTLQKKLGGYIGDNYIQNDNKNITKEPKDMTMELRNAFIQCITK
jgi:hypothetical protein